MISTKVFVSVFLIFSVSSAPTPSSIPITESSRNDVIEFSSVDPKFKTDETPSTEHLNSTTTPAADNSPTTTLVYNTSVTDEVNTGVPSEPDTSGAPVTGTSAYFSTDSETPVTPFIENANITSTVATPSTVNDLTTRYESTPTTPIVVITVTSTDSETAGTPFVEDVNKTSSAATTLSVTLPSESVSTSTFSTTTQSSHGVSVLLSVLVLVLTLF